jgi:hypothetical protein
VSANEIIRITRNLFELKWNGSRFVEESASMFKSVSTRPWFYGLIVSTRDLSHIVGLALVWAGRSLGIRAGSGVWNSPISRSAED